MDPASAGQAASSAAQTMDAVKIRGNIIMRTYVRAAQAASHLLLNRARQTPRTGPRSRFSRCNPQISQERNWYDADLEQYVDPLLFAA
jgi:hypothetical protein